MIKQILNNKCIITADPHTAPVSGLCRGLQQLQLPLIGKRILILHQQAMHVQPREELDQLRRRVQHT